MSVMLRVDPIACKAHGMCAELFPEGIRLDDWGYPIVDGRRVPDSLLAHAKAAVSQCPRSALRLVSDGELALERRAREIP